MESTGKELTKKKLKLNRQLGISGRAAAKKIRPSPTGEF
jgi:hypothetical protein